MGKAGDVMEDKPTVLVGVDGSESSLRALDWAAAAAQVRGHSLQVVCAYTVPSFGPTSVDATYLDLSATALEEGARAVLKDAVERAQRIHPGVSAHLEVGDAAAVMVKLSKRASLAIVGTRGKGGFAERLLGTVSTALPVHAHCPTVVVPIAWGQDGTGQDDWKPVRKIVVGVDGSEASKVALAHAVDQALAWEAELIVFSSIPVAAGTSMFAWAPGPIDHSAVLAELEVEVGRLIQDELSSRQLPETFSIRHHALDGTASSLLVEFSDSVDLVVVGSRGRGGFSGLLLGSTSQAVLHHARCPVMVVPVRLKESKAAANRAADGSS
jgi:nucleotide-binding universal stress UspA family protein